MDDIIEVDVISAMNIKVRPKRLFDAFVYRPDTKDLHVLV
jgi:hypothetical protein